MFTCDGYGMLMVNVAKYDDYDDADDADADDYDKNNKWNANAVPLAIWPFMMVTTMIMMMADDEMCH